MAGNLTIDRPTVTAAQLNAIWDNLTANIATMLPQILRYIDASRFDDISIDESDPEAAYIETGEDVAFALTTKANRLFFTSGPALSSDNNPDTKDGSIKGFDDIYRYWVKIEPDLDNSNFSGYKREDKPIESRPDFQRDFWDLDLQQGTGNKWLVDGEKTGKYSAKSKKEKEELWIRNLLYETRYKVGSKYQGSGKGGLTGTLVTGVINGDIPRYSQNLSTIKNLGRGYTATPISARNEQGINVPTTDMSLKERLNLSSALRKATGCDTKCVPSVPVRDCINATDPDSIIDNSYMKLPTGDLLPLRLLPKTAFEEILLQGQALTREQRTSIETSTQTIFEIKFDASVTGEVSITEVDKKVNNSTSTGWFDSGFLGTETFEESGSVEEWNAGETKILSIINLGYKGKSAEVTKYNYGNGYNEWFTDKSYILGKSESWDDGFKEGKSPSKPNNSIETLYITENLTEQCTGSNNVFKLNNLYETTTLHVYWNGVRQSDVQITELTSSTFSTSFVPASIDVVVVDYMPL